MQKFYGRFDALKHKILDVITAWRIKPVVFLVTERL